MSLLDTERLTARRRNLIPAKIGQYVFVLQYKKTVKKKKKKKKKKFSYF